MAKRLQVHPTQIFNAKPNRIMFAGHFHDWLLAKPNGITDWKGESPVRLDDGRYFAVIGAMREGRYAIFDSDTSDLLPFNDGR